METLLHAARWRFVRLVAIASLVAMLALATCTPVVADAAVVSPTYTGWAEVNQTFRCLAMLPHCVDPHYPAWRWTGTTWTYTTVRHGTDVYVHPYAGEWRWIWTRQTGWLAISGRYVMFDAA